MAFSVAVIARTGLAANGHAVVAKRKGLVVELTHKEAVHLGLDWEGATLYQVPVRIISEEEDAQRKI